jgi:hypothetical protein
MAADGQDSTRTRTWHRSSRCSPVGNCVDINRVYDYTIVRDSKGAAELRAFDETQWTAFLDYCRLAY